MTASPGSAPKPAPKPSGTPPPTANPAGVGDDVPPLTKPLHEQDTAAAIDPPAEASDASDVAGKVADRATEAATTVREKAAEAASTVSAKTAAAADKVTAKTSEAADKVTAKTSEAAEKVSAKTSEATDKVAAKTSEAAEKVSAKVSRSSDSAPSTVGRHAAEPSIGQLVSDATTAVSTLVRSEIELAKLELRSTVKNAGTGIGLFLGAAVVLIFSLTFGFIALAEGIAALGVYRWLSFLIVFVLQLLVVGLFVFIGIRKVKAVRAPEQTIRTTKETVDYLKSHKPQG